MLFELIRPSRSLQFLYFSKRKSNYCKFYKWLHFSILIQLLGDQTERSPLSQDLRYSPTSRVQLGYVTGWTGESSLFHEQDLRRADMVVRYSAVSSWGHFSLLFRLEKSKWFPSFYCVDLSVCFLNTCDSCIAWGREFSSLLVSSRIKRLINWLVLFPTEYSLCYPLWDKLIHV